MITETQRKKNKVLNRTAALGLDPDVPLILQLSFIETQLDPNLADLVTPQLFRGARSQEASAAAEVTAEVNARLRGPETGRQRCECGRRQICNGAYEECGTVPVVCAGQLKIITADVFLIH